MSAAAPLPDGIRSRQLADINGLDVHVLEAGDPSRPAVLLLHGFPELAYSWRHVMAPLAAAGFHVIAPDQRGYGKTTGWDPAFDCDLSRYGFLNLVRDAMGVLAAVGRDGVTCVAGHDFGSPVAAMCALLRPDVFRSVALMSAPFAGPPAMPNPGRRPETDIDEALAALSSPRKHYHRYYSTPEANDNMWHAEAGVHNFLRAYFHYKSADWPGNKPFSLAARTAAELAKLPTYYVMNLHDGMAETVAAEMPDAAAIAACRWLPDEELAYYASEYSRTGFQGGLNWYRARSEPRELALLQVFAGRTIDVPAIFIAGAQDWGVRQAPGAFERMQNDACTRMTGYHLLEGAGHWVQQEQAAAVAQLLIEFAGAQ